VAKALFSPRSIRSREECYRPPVAVVGERKQVPRRTTPLLIGDWWYLETFSTELGPDAVVVGVTDGDGFAELGRLDGRYLSTAVAGGMTGGHLVVDVRDAMGANAVNSMAEAVAARVAEIAGGRVCCAS
jgi:hypothetical protein